MKKCATSDPTIIIYYDESQIDRIKNIRFSVDGILEEIRRLGKNCNYHTTDEEGLWVCYDWTTGIEFDNHMGGGYYICFEEDWYNGLRLIEVCSEWYDSWAEEHDYEKCKDEYTQLKDSLIEVQRFIKRL